jgi:SAM-dependent methyltransferase
MVPVLFGPWASHLAEAAGPQAGERVLDLACGTGIVARVVAGRLGAERNITAIDLNPNMLAVARAAAEREGLQVDWHEGRAEQLPFPDGAFDLVLCQFGLMFFADRPAALAEAHRVLAPGGRLFLNVWQGLDRHPFYRTLDDVIQRRLDVSALQAIFALGDAEELRSLLAGAGFGGIQIDPASRTARFPDPPGFLAGEIAVDTAAIPSMQQMDERDRQAMLDAIREDMEAPLEEVTRDDHVVLEFHAHVAGARRGS